MAEANVGCGAPRIRGVLLKLGIEVFERTVSCLMPKRSTAPSQMWRAFLDNQVRDLVSIELYAALFKSDDRNKSGIVILLNQKVRAQMDF
jgi:hypothetical protein